MDGLTTQLNLPVTNVFTRRHQLQEDPEQHLMFMWSDANRKDSLWPRGDEEETKRRRRGDEEETKRSRDMRDFLQFPPAGLFLYRMTCTVYWWRASLITPGSLHWHVTTCSWIYSTLHHWREVDFVKFACLFLIVLQFVCNSRLHLCLFWE